MNFFEAGFSNGIIRNGEGLKLKVPEGKSKVLREKGYEGKSAIFGIRPHNEQVAIDAAPTSTVNGLVEVSELLGSEIMVYSKIGDAEFISKIDSRETYQPCDTIQLTFNLIKAHFFDKKTEEVITLL